MKIAQKVAQYLGKFLKRLCLNDFSKVAQSGHTAHQKWANLPKMFSQDLKGTSESAFYSKIDPFPATFSFIFGLLKLKIPFDNK